MDEWTDGRGWKGGPRRNVDDIVKPIILDISALLSVGPIFPFFFLDTKEKRAI